MNKGNTDFIDVIHHFFGASLGLWLVFILVENKSHAKVFLYLFLILVVLSTVLYLLANAFKNAISGFKCENLYKRIVYLYSWPVGLTSIFVLLLLHIEDNIFEKNTPGCQFVFLFLLVLFWIIVFEAYLFVSFPFPASSNKKSKRK